MIQMMIQMMMSKTKIQMMRMLMMKGIVMNIMTSTLMMKSPENIIRMMRVIKIAWRMNLRLKTIGLGFAHLTTSEISDIAYKAYKIFEIKIT